MQTITVTQKHIYSDNDAQVLAMDIYQYWHLRTWCGKTDSCNVPSIIEYMASRILDGLIACHILVLFSFLFAVGFIQLYFSLSNSNELQCFETP